MTCSLQRLLVIIGLCVIPFYELIFRCFPFVRVLAPDTREPKELIAMVFALSIGLLAVFQGTLKPFRNKFFLIIPIYILFSLFLAPHVDMFINNVESGDFYFWRPFCEVLCFLLMVIAISSFDCDFDGIIKIMVICASIMSVYVILQRLGFDQFYIAKTEQWFTAVHGEAYGGNLGQPTIVSSFIIMMIPLAFYLRKFWMALIMVVAVLVTTSMMAISAIAFMYLVSFIYTASSYNIPKKIIICILIIIIGIGFLNIGKVFNIVKNHSSGRFTEWKETFNDIREGPITGMKNDYSFTGVGLGRFPFIYPDKHKSQFQQAHNELLEFTYNCGIIGLILLVLAIYHLFSIPIINGAGFLTPLTSAIIVSLLGIFFISLGSFPFQLGAHQFYISVLVGLLSNGNINRRITC